jgi:hypothetical protein
MAEYVALRQGVERLGGKPQGRRFEGELRRRLVAHVDERRATGASLATIGLAMVRKNRGATPALLAALLIGASTPSSIS